MVNHLLLPWLLSFGNFSFHVEVASVTLGAILDRLKTISQTTVARVVILIRKHLQTSVVVLVWWSGWWRWGVWHYLPQWLPLSLRWLLFECNLTHHYEWIQGGSLSQVNSFGAVDIHLIHWVLPLFDIGWFILSFIDDPFLFWLLWVLWGLRLLILLLLNLCHCHQIVHWQ